MVAVSAVTKRLDDGHSRQHASTKSGNLGKTAKLQICMVYMHGTWYDMMGVPTIGTQHTSTVDERDTLILSRRCTISTFVRPWKGRLDHAHQVYLCERLAKNDIPLDTTLVGYLTGNAVPNRFSTWNTPSHSSARVTSSLVQARKNNLGGYQYYNNTAQQLGGGRNLPTPSAKAKPTLEL